jgi:hypothetical protein
MLRDVGDLWNPSVSGSNIIPCGEWGPQATRLEILLGDTFVIQGTVPSAKGGGVVTVDAIFDPHPNFNLAGRLYKSTRFYVEDILDSDKETSFNLTVVLPRSSPPGPFSVQVKFVALEAKYAFFQCADLNGIDPDASQSWNAFSWWIGGLIALAVGVVVAILAYCICCKKCCSKRAKAEPIDGRTEAPESPLDYPGQNDEVSLKDPRGDREVSEGSLEIEDMAQSETESSSDDEVQGAKK